MKTSVLVVTPSPGFGELISQILQETGDYTCLLATNSRDGLESVKAHPPALCILDGDLADAPLEKLAAGLRKSQPGLLLVVIPPDSEDAPLDFTRLEADGLLAKPFYLPDLITTVERVLAGGKPEAGAPAPEGAVPVRAAEAGGETAAPSPAETPAADAPEWLRDVNLAAQHLARLSLESASQASLIAKGDQVWAYAGELDQGAVGELAGTLGHYWSGGDGSDLARFVRLEATGSDYMLYATDLGGGFVLAMVFDTETPFSKIRTQAGSLAQRLASPPENLTETAPESIEADEEGELGPLPPLFDDVPPPIPGDWMPERMTAVAHRPFLEELFQSPPAAETFSRESSPAMRRPFDVAVEEDLDATTPSRAPAHAAETMPSEAESDEDIFAATVPSRSGQPKGEGPRLEPISPAMVNLTYSCVLIPRLPEHYLTGDLASRVSEWVTQLCLAFGWRLEQLSVRPEVLQWMVNVPPQTSPGYLMRIIRQHTSRRLFVEFPRYAESNPSGDFWAPGYLIMSGPQAPPPKLVKDFIKETRVRQGISK
jgi:DNA-binding response OmpR family regulator/REP element-mobilizing transposase RayT